MKKEDFYFDLPDSLIAQTPLQDRAGARLLVLRKETGEICHKTFRDIVEYFRPGDCLVLNDTKVIPARLIGTRKGTGARVEILLLTRKDICHWEVLVHPGKKARTGDIIEFGGLMTAEVIEVVNGGNRIVKFQCEGIFEETLDRLGEMPLPPYIKTPLADRSRYQTVYAVHDGSAAAPTAGLHFTPELLEEIARKGVEIAKLTLHVGLGTFRPVKVSNILEHEMHAEFYHIVEEQCEKINRARREGGRIVAVGTTSCRTLEACSREGVLKAGSGWTDIFIYPGYRFQMVDMLVTNFHLPESTLIMLVSALCGREKVLRAYEEAVKEQYRFFSFGDAMLINMD